MTKLAVRRTATALLAAAALALPVVGARASGSVGGAGYGVLACNQHGPGSEHQPIHP
jgi:hypothetical protein